MWDYFNGFGKIDTQRKYSEYFIYRPDVTLWNGQRGLLINYRQNSFKL